MAATTTKPRGAKDKAAAEHLHDALEDLDKAREKTSEDVSARIDSARERIRDARDELSERGRDEVKGLREQLGDATDEALREVGRLAIRAQRSREALGELSEEITKRRTELTR